MIRNVNVVFSNRFQPVTINSARMRCKWTCALVSYLNECRNVYHQLSDFSERERKKIVGELVERWKCVVDCKNTDLDGSFESINRKQIINRENRSICQSRPRRKKNCTHFQSASCLTRVLKKSTHCLTRSRSNVDKIIACWLKSRGCWESKFLCIDSISMQVHFPNEVFAFVHLTSPL